MQAYAISPNVAAPTIFVGDMKALRATLRERIPKEARQWCRVTLEEYDTSKGSVLNMLNGRDPLRTAVKRKWRLGARGRLIEILVTED